MSGVKPQTRPPNLVKVEPQGSPGDVPEAAYKVGYKHPPEASRFRPGQSGNPRGRPSGRRNAKTEVAEVFDQIVRVHEKGRTRKMSAWRAMCSSLLVEAIKGDPRPFNALINLATKTGYLGDKKDERAGRDDLPARPGTAVFENIDSRLLCDEDMIELSRIGAVIDLGGDFTALSTRDFERLKEIMEKARGKDVTAPSDTDRGDTP